MSGIAESSSSGRRWGALRWVSLVAVVWVVLADERLSGYRIAGSGSAALVLHGLGSAAVIATAALGGTALWKRSRRFTAVAVTVLSLVCAAPIALLDWRSLHARAFYLAHRSDFVTLVDMVRRGYLISDNAGGTTLPTNLEYLSANRLVAAGLINNDGVTRVLFLPAGRVGGCNTGYIDPQEEVDKLEIYHLCRIQMPLGGGWVWLD